MNVHSNEKMAHIYGEGKAIYNRLVQIMSTNLYIPVSQRYNAKYNEFDLHAALIELSTGNMFAESGMAKLAMESGMDVPSGSWIRDTVESVDYVQLIAMLEGALETTLA